MASYGDISRVVGKGSTFILLGDGLGSGDAVSYYTGSRVLDWPAQADLALDRLSGQAPVDERGRLSSAIRVDKRRWMVIINQQELRAQPDLGSALAGYPSPKLGGQHRLRPQHSDSMSHC